MLCLPCVVVNNSECFDILLTRALQICNNDDDTSCIYLVFGGIKLCVL